MKTIFQIPRKSCCGNSLFPPNYFMPWPSLRPKSKHLLLVQHHPEVPSLHCCLGSLSLLGNPADIEVWLLHNFLLLLPKADNSLQLQGHQQFEFRGLQQGCWSLKVYSGTLSRHESSFRSILYTPHIHFISYYCISYAQASKTEFCQQTPMYFLPYRLQILHYIFIFRHSLEDNPFLQSANTILFHSLSFKTCVCL